MPSVIMTKRLDKLDPKVQSKTVAFLGKLTENDATAGLHVEPVKNCADPRVRTARVDQQYRAVLFQLGGKDTAYVLYGIYNHDEAYKVAARVRLTVNPINAMPEIEVLPEVPEPPRWQAPPVPSRRPLIDLVAADLIAGLGIPPTVAEQAVAITDEDAMLHFAEGLPEWQGTALLSLSAGAGIADVVEELSLSVNKQTPEGAVQAFDETRDISDEEILAGFNQPAAGMTFYQADGIEDLQQIIAEGDFAAWKRYLHPSQRKWVTKDYNGPFRLRGGAGTGKTVVALHRARRLALADPSTRILLTTFTKNLAHDLDVGLRGLDPSLPRANKLGESGVLVQGLDALANHVLRSAGEEVSQAVAAVLGTGRVDVQRRTPAMAWEDALTIAGSDLPEPLHSRRFMEAEYQLVVLPSRITTEEEYLRAPRPGRGVRLTRRDRKAVWAVVAAYRQAARMGGSIDFAEAAAIAAAHLDQQGTRPVRHLLVDEGQDFSPCHWQFVRSLVADGGNDIFIVEDGHQRIYGYRIVLSRFGIRTQGRSRRLTLNYRTTKQNLDWAVSVLAGHEFVDSEGELDTADGYCSARGGPVPRVLSVLGAQEELNVAAQQLRTWLKQGRAPESLAVLVRDKAMRQRVVEGLAEREIQSQAVETGGVSSGKVAVLTMHRAKGMEFACVLLHGMSEKSIPMGLEEYGYDESDKSEALLRERSLIYVAASRARDELVITYSGVPSPLLPDPHAKA